MWQPQLVNIKATDLVRIKRDITRQGALYAKTGECGVVEEVFRNSSQSGTPGSRGTWHAKVRIGSTLKTVRLTSIEKVRRPRACSLCGTAFTNDQHEFSCPQCGAECAGADVV